MRDFIEAFIKGFIKGAKETPRGFFAPAVAIWQLLVETTDALTDRAPQKRIGVAKGRFEVPDSVDSRNADIAITFNTDRKV